MRAARSYQNEGYPMTFKEYLAFDQASDLKHEYVDGYVVAMAGASARHNRITGAVIGALFAGIGSGRCIVAPSDQRIAIPSGNYRYLDVTVTCGEALYERRDGVEILLNPTLIVEVLSPSTATIDQGQKVWEYQQLVSVQDYLVVAQERPQVMHHHRRDATSWLLTTHTGLDAQIDLDHLGMSLALAAIYRQVTFDEDSA